MKAICSAKNASTPIFVFYSFAFAKTLLTPSCIVGQKKDIKRQKEKLEAMKKEADAEMARAKEAARERVLLDFEKGQLFPKTASGTTTSGADTQEGMFYGLWGFDVV